MSQDFQLGLTALLTAEQRAQELLRDHVLGRLRIPLTREELAILRKLVYHVGHRNAIPRRDLELSAGVSERQVKAVVRNLIVTHRLPIGASRAKDNGYFLIATAEDLDIASKALISEGREIFRRLRVLHGPERVAELLGQLPLEEGVSTERAPSSASLVRGRSSEALRSPEINEEEKFA